MTNKKLNYNLEERTAKFGEEVIAFAKRLPQNSITRPLIIQLVKASTSVGANYCEADNAFTKKEFIHKIGICKQESRESKHWLRMILKATDTLRDENKRLQNEAQELNLIFASIIKKCKK